MSKIEKYNYFLCSEEVKIKFPLFNYSDAFKSGYEYDNENYYIGYLDFEKIEDFYKNNETFDFWCRELVAGYIDVDKITLKNIRNDGLFVEINNKTNLSSEKNIAICIYNLCQKYNVTPFEFIKKIT